MPFNSLTKAELARYERQIILPKLGEAGQLKLKNASALIVGAGGLGCPILQYLAAAGIGCLGIIDFDHVSESNLHRQILFNSGDIGKAKALVAAEKLQKQNPHIQIDAIVDKISPANVLEHIAPYDLVIDGSDNFSTKYLLNDACILANKVLIFGSIYDFEGQVSVFNWNGGASYRCLFPELPDPDSVPSCAEHGVIGVLPAIIGSLQAMEAIKVITGIGEPLSSKLLIFNCLSMQSQTISFSRNEKNFKITQLGSYSDYCILPPNEIRQVEASEFDSAKYEVIDIRSAEEVQSDALPNAKHIPMDEIDERLAEINKSKPVLVVCHIGERSQRVAFKLQSRYGFAHVFNLAGGIKALKTKIKI
jgi:adenylyltransferase/sulfurtransferase